MENKAKPFVKWAGGKTSLLKTLEANLPADFNTKENVTYIEPFVGGGAMLFHMLNNHKNIKRVVINDINSDLIACYRYIKENPKELIEALESYEATYKREDSIEYQRATYYAFRELYNDKNRELIDRAALFICLNHICFNGLYRVNSKGEFNVPIGRYKNPTICNKDVILEDSKVLNSVELIILNGDYKEIKKRLSNRYFNFVYLDPPYRPLSVTSNFKEYSNSPFGDAQQIELKHFFDYLSERHCGVMESNSDSRNEDGSSFFEELYEGYNFQRVYAPRYINAFQVKRESLTEVLMKNY